MVGKFEVVVESEITRIEGKWWLSEGLLATCQYCQGQSIGGIAQGSMGQPKLLVRLDTFRAMRLWGAATCTLYFQG